MTCLILVFVLFSSATVRDCLFQAIFEQLSVVVGGSYSEAKMNKIFAFDDSKSIFRVDQTSLVQELQLLLPVVVVRHGGTNSEECLTQICKAIHDAYQTHLFCAKQFCEVVLGDRQSIDFDVHTHDFFPWPGEIVPERFIDSDS